MEALLGQASSEIDAHRPERGDDHDFYDDDGEVGAAH
jgi:hypothetical protein